MLEFRIASPCSQAWKDMSGDERVRHCAACKLNVFNVSELSETEVRALLMKAEGRVCGRIYRRPDGTVLTKDCPKGLAALRRKFAGAVVLALAVLISVNERWSSNAAAPLDLPRWYAAHVSPRLAQARDVLRQTRVFGPLINEFWPREAVMGDMVALPPTHP